MRPLMTAAVAAVLAAAAVAAPVPKDKEKEKPKDEEAVLGTWRTKSLDVGNGVVPAPAEFQKVGYVFGEKGGMTMQRDGKVMLEGTFKVDATAKLKTLDIVRKDGIQVLCLYELDGDTLKLCLTQRPGAARPPEFKGDAKTVTVVFVLERETADKGK